MLERRSVAHYSADEIISNFAALIDSIDFKSILQDLSIGRLPLGRRAKALREFKALCICLWNLCLQKSFPDNAADFFTRYCETSPLTRGDTPESAKLRGRVGIYLDLLRDKKESDFLPVASYLAEVLALNAEDSRSLRLKISLITRNLYTLIFDKLV